MAKETKTVQCYPDDDIVNDRIHEYESFGWELITNQRCQEFDGTTYGIDGSSTRHYSTFNKLTFTRDKSASWYTEVAGYETEYFRLLNTKPSKPYHNKLHCFFTLLAVFFMFSIVPSITMFALGIWQGGIICLLPIAAAIAIFIAMGQRKKKYNHAYGAYLGRLREWESTDKKEADKIRKKASDSVNA